MKLKLENSVIWEANLQSHLVGSNHLSSEDARWGAQIILSSGKILAFVPIFDVYYFINEKMAASMKLELKGEVASKIDSTEGEKRKLKACNRSLELESRGRNATQNWTKEGENSRSKAQSRKEKVMK